MNFFEFDYAGQKYQYMVQMFSPTTKSNFEDCVNDDTAPKFTMSYEGIRRIEYWNTVLDPLLRARIDYLDMYGDVSVFIGMPYVYCHVILKKVLPEDQKGEEDYLFSHTFLVTSVDVVERVGNRLRYVVNMVSNAWWSFESSVSFSNYDRPEPQTAPEILKELFTQHGLTLNVQDKLNFKDRFYYVAAAQDTLLTAYKHVLSKAYQVKSASFGESKICPIVYNDMDRQYYWIDISDKDQYQYQVASNKKYIEYVHVSLYTGFDQIMQQGKTFFTNANRMSKTDVYDFMRQVDHALYNFEAGEFAYVSNPQQQRAQYLASQITGEYAQQKFIPFDRTQTVGQKPAALNNLKYYRMTSEWDNPVNNFLEGLGILAKCDTVVVNSPGSTSRRPGMAVYLNFDTDEQLSLVDKEQISQYKKLESKMVGLMGTWFVTQVRHVVDFTKRQPVFRDDISLGRNFRLG